MSNKLEQDRWERENEEDIIDRFLFDYEDKIKNIVKHRMKYIDVKSSNYLNNHLSEMFSESKDTQYALYLDTEESDHMKEGCSFSKGERSEQNIKEEPCG